jgi:hypothetical protein
MSGAQVEDVIKKNQDDIRRACWAHNPTPKPTVAVTVSMTVGADGTPQQVSADGDEASVASCIESLVSGWRFPAIGCAQKTRFAFKFVRQ